MTRDDLVRELCMTQSAGKSADDLRARLDAAGAHNGALESAHEAVDCESYAKTISNVLRKNHKVDATPLYNIEKAGACLEEARKRGWLDETPAKKK